MSKVLLLHTTQITGICSTLLFFPVFVFMMVAIPLELLLLYICYIWLVSGNLYLMKSPEYYAVYATEGKFFVIRILDIWLTCSLAPWHDRLGKCHVLS